MTILSMAPWLMGRGRPLRSGGRAPALRCGWPRNKGGRPPFDPVLMFEILVLQALYWLSDEATEFQIKDRLSFQQFMGLRLDGMVPDATIVWLFRELYWYWLPRFAGDRQVAEREDSRPQCVGLLPQASSRAARSAAFGL